MLKKYFFLTVLGIFSFAAFAKVTTDVEAGLTYSRFGSTSESETNGVKQKDLTMDAFGLNLACDVEFNEHFGLFVDMDFLIPYNTSLTLESGGQSITVHNEDFLQSTFAFSCLEGAEYIKYFSDDFKIRLGGGIASAVTCFEGEASGITMYESDFLLGLGFRANADYQFNSVVGIQGGLKTLFCFTGSAGYTYKDNYGNETTDSGRIKDCVYFINPSISMVFHIGGSH